MPDGVRSALLLLFALFLVFLNGFFVAAEFALVKVRATRLEELATKKQFGAQKALDAVRHLDAYLSATQLGITLASLGLGYVGEPAFAHLLEPLLEGRVSESVKHLIAGGIAFTVITMLHIVLGELAPKSLAIQRPEPTTLAIIYPLDLFYRLFKAPIRFMNRLAALVLKPFGVVPVGEHDGGDAHSEEELRLIVSASREGGEIKESEHSLINRVLDFAHRKADEVMVPRPDVVFLTTAKTVAENIRLAEDNGYTRYPLCEKGSPDDVVGMIHVKDLLALSTRRTVPSEHVPRTDAEQLRQIAREMPRIPENRPIDALLRDLQRTRRHMAIVVDEYGGTAGIVTVEDIVEEIVGDIQDEFDRTTPELEPVGTDCFLVDARMPLDKLRRTLEFLGPEEDTETDTVGGFLLASRPAGTAFVRVGDALRYGEATFTVAEMTGRRIRKVRVCLPGRERDAALTPGED